MNSFLENNYQWLLSGIIPTSITIIVSIIIYKWQKKKMLSRFQSTINANNSSGNIVQGDNSKIIVGDTSNTEENRYQSAYHLIKEEIISNFIIISTLAEGIEERLPEKFWDIRKPNESEDTYQERAKNFHKIYQNGIFQLVQTFKIKKEVFNIHRKDLSFQPQITDYIQNTYKWQEEAYENIQSYSDGLLHNMSINDRDLKIHIENISLHKEKITKTRILLLQSINSFISAYLCEESIILHIFQSFKFESITGSDSIEKNRINMEIRDLHLKSASIIQKRIAVPQRDLEIDRIIKDPYLQLMRKSFGLANELSEADYFGLLHKKIDTETSDTIKLLSLAAASYSESDGRASIYYLEKALTNKKNPINIQVFIKKSIMRLHNPDIYDGGIGLIILEISEGSVWVEKIKRGDIFYKINGEIIYEPSEISSVMAKTKREEDVLFEIYNQKGRTVTMAVPGRTHLGCIITQSIMPNCFLV